MRKPDYAKCEALYKMLKVQKMSPCDIKKAFNIKNDTQTRTFIDVASLLYPIYEESYSKFNVVYGVIA